MNRVYLIEKQNNIMLLAAKDVEEARDFIKAFKKQDTRYSLGCSMVTEYDQILNLYSPEKGIIWNHYLL